jgi:act minimal PKS acyl carrier protein
MPAVFTIDDLKRVLAQGAGLDGSIDLDQAHGTSFAELGYDSLAMLETAARVEREFAVSLDESQIADTETVQGFIDSVNGSLIRTS